jgi:hypothetical protein
MSELRTLLHQLELLQGSDNHNEDERLICFSFVCVSETYDSSEGSKDVDGPSTTIKSFVQEKIRTDRKGIWSGFMNNAASEIQIGYGELSKSTFKTSRVAHSAFDCQPLNMKWSTYQDIRDKTIKEVFDSINLGPMNKLVLVFNMFSRNKFNSDMRSHKITDSDMKRLSPWIRP